MALARRFLGRAGRAATPVMMVLPVGVGVRAAAGRGGQGTVRAGAAQVRQLAGRRLGAQRRRHL